MTPIRCGADAWAHQDVRPGDTVAWPTNLGWMMGPWLLYAALLNGACIALYQVNPEQGLVAVKLVESSARVQLDWCSAGVCLPVHGTELCSWNVLIICPRM